MVTLTYEYSRSHVWLDDLRAAPDPHAYDLCAGHGERVTVPQGWYLTDRTSRASRRSAPEGAGLLAG